MGHFVPYVPYIRMYVNVPYVKDKYSENYFFGLEIWYIMAIQYLVIDMYTNKNLYFIIMREILLNTCDIIFS